MSAPPPPPPPPSRAWTWVLRVCAACSVLPLFCARHLPMTDLPEHVAVMSTLRHYGDPAWRAREYFTIGSVFDTQYWLYHVTGAALSLVMGGAERGNLLLLALVGVAYPYALRELLRALRLDERFAVLGAAFFWSRSLTTGLLNFVASVPVLVFALAVVVRHAETPTRRRAIGLAALALAVFYLHISSYFLFAGQALLATWLLVGTKPVAAKLAIAARRCLWLAPSLLAAVVVGVRGTVASRGAHAMIFTPRLTLARELPHWMFDCFRSPVDDVLGWLLVGAVAVRIGADLAGRRARRNVADRAGDDQRRRRVVGWVLFAMTLVVYFVLPSAVGGFAGALDVRMAVFVGVFAALLVPRAEGRRAWIPAAVAAAATMTIGVHAAWQTHAFEEDEVGGFDALLRRMPHGARLLTLNFDPVSKYVHLGPFNFFGAYYRIRYGGIASFSFSELDHWPVHYRPEAAPPQRLTWGDPCVFRNARDGRHFDYVLTRGETNPFAYEPPGPRWVLVGESRAWHLYARTNDADAAADDRDGAAPTSDADDGPCAPHPQRLPRAANGT